MRRRAAQREAEARARMVQQGDSVDFSVGRSIMSSSSSRRAATCSTLAGEDGEDAEESSELLTHWECLDLKRCLVARDNGEGTLSRTEVRQAVDEMQLRGRVPREGGDALTLVLDAMLESSTKGDKAYDQRVEWKVFFEWATEGARDPATRATRCKPLKWAWLSPAAAREKATQLFKEAEHLQTRLTVGHQGADPAAAAKIVARSVAHANLLSALASRQEKRASSLRAQSKARADSTCCADSTFSLSRSASTGGPQGSRRECADTFRLYKDVVPLDLRTRSAQGDTAGQLHKTDRWGKVLPTERALLSRRLTAPPVPTQHTFYL